MACAGASASSGNCAAGAMGAAASSVLAKLISAASGDGLSSEEREARGNLIASIVAGMSEAISVDPSTSTIAAVTELTNYALTLSQLKQFEAEASACEAIGNCDQVQQKFRELSMETREVMIAVCAADRTACRERFGEIVEQSTEYRKQLDRLLGMDLPDALKGDLGIYFVQNAEAASIVLNTEIAADLQKRYGVSPEVAERAMLVGSAVAGMIKGAKGTGTAGIPDDAIKALPGPRQIEASWSASTYNKGGLMTGIEHVFYRHGPESGFSNVGKFSQGTSLKDVSSYVDSALRYGKVSPNGPGGYVIEYNAGKVIGTNSTGVPTSTIKVNVRGGVIQTAFPF